MPQQLFHEHLTGMFSICYVHDDDTAMEEIRNFIEDISNLKCCIPQRDFGACDTDDVTALEQSLDKSASTVVLWSRAALASKWHKAEYKMARYIELYRHFDFRVIHIFLEELGDVTDVSLKHISASGEYMQWISKAHDGQKQKFFEQLVAKIYRRLAESRV